MNNMLRMSMLCGVIASGISFVNAKVFTIDSGRLLRESKEGKSILMLNEKDKESVLKEEYEQSKKVADLRSSIEEELKKENVVSEDKLQEKYAELTGVQRKAKRLLDDVKEEVDMKTQGRVVKFRNKVLAIASEIFEKGNCSLVLDKGTPGVVYISKSIDKTSEVLKEINFKFERDKAKTGIVDGKKKNT